MDGWTHTHTRADGVQNIVSPRPSAWWRQKKSILCILNTKILDVKVFKYKIHLNFPSQPNTNYKIHKMYFKYVFQIHVSKILPISAHTQYLPIWYVKDSGGKSTQVL